MVQPHEWQWFYITFLLTFYTPTTITLSGPQGLCTCVILLGHHASSDRSSLIFQASIQKSFPLKNLPTPTSFSQTQLDLCFIYFKFSHIFPSDSTYFSMYFYFCFCESVSLYLSPDGWDYVYFDHYYSQHLEKWKTWRKQRGKSVTQSRSKSSQQSQP